MPDSAAERIAIVLFNLGGPDRPAAIRPFLLNLFRDPAILRVPFFIRPLGILQRVKPSSTSLQRIPAISSRRCKVKMAIW